MLHYLLQILIFQLLFLLVYDIFHKKDTFFNWNRLYLIITPFLSLILPFIQLEFLSSSTTEVVVTNIERTLIAPTERIIFDTTLEKTTANTNGITLNWWLIAYLVGILLSLINLVLKFHKLRILKNVSYLSKVFNHKVIVLPNSSHAFSFWNTIFIGDALTSEEREHIISHELVHVHQKHTIDQIGIEILKILLWWNPLVYIYQARITLLHEYIADALTVHKINQRSYIEQLLNAAFQTEKITFINQFFNKSLIKKRILMLQKSQSKSIAKFKYLLLIPVLAGILTYTSCKDGSSTSSEESNSTLTEEKSSNNKIAVSNQPACLNKGSKYDYKLDNYLKIESGENADIIAKLISLETDEVIRTAVMYKNQTHYVRNIPQGTYRVDVTYGEDYEQKETNGICSGGFKKEIMFETGEDILDFTTVTREGGIDVPSYTLALDILPEELRNNPNHSDEVAEKEAARKKAMEMAQKLAAEKARKMSDAANLGNANEISKEKAEPNCANNDASRYQMKLDNYLKIINGENSEVIVNVVNLETSESVRTVHLPKNSKHFVRNVPEGIYNLEIVYGMDLKKNDNNGNCELSFNNKLAEESGEDELDFNIIKTSHGINVPSYSITLDVLDQIK